MVKKRSLKKKEVSKVDKRTIQIFLRYLAILILGLFNLKIVYLIFKPLTVYGTYFLLKTFSNPVLQGATITLKNTDFQIINACVIGSAYYLIFILFFSFQKIKIKTRVYSLLSALSLLLVFNILRIVILMLISKNILFEQIHWLFWHFISTGFILIIVFSIIKAYKISEVPFKEDLKHFLKLIKK